MLRKRVALTLAAATLGSLGLVSPAEANHAWGTYHWARTTSSFTLLTGDNLTAADWKGHLATAANDWTQSIVLNLTPVTGLSNKRCSATAGRVEVCNGKYGQNGWLGLAQIWLSGSHITQGTAKMNDTYFSTAKYNNPNEKLHVMCQEVGHTFGLGHQSEDGSSQNSCMDYFSNTGANAGSTISTHPNSHDYTQLESIYNHLDSTTTVGTTSTGAAPQQVGDDRSTWGQEIERGAHGEFSIFERDFGNGEKVLTHVTWADDRQADGRAHAPE